MAMIRPRTVVARAVESPPNIIELEPAAPKKQTPAKPVTATPQKKTTPTNVKPSIEKKTEPTRPAKKKEKTLRNRQQLQESLQKIEKSITQIERKHDKLKNPRELTVPSQPLMPSSSTVLEEDARYVSSLVGYLQEHLRLPDVGEVKMEIHLHSDGKVESIKVLSAESILNRKKLEDILPTLQFPIPPSNNRIFIVTFCHNL